LFSIFRERKGRAIKEKERLDQLLVTKGLVASREKGKALIMAGVVYVNQVKVDKPGTLVSSADALEIRGKTAPYVSRGGLKLEKAIRAFHLEPAGRIVLDIGASTGGFTHCALSYGAAKAYAVDVGYGQLDWSLRQDARVINLERVNARYLTREQIPEDADLITIDVSFISLEKIFPAISGFLKEDGTIVALVKPQFEAGRENVGKKGVVREKNIHLSVLNKVIQAARECGLEPVGLDYSPVKGPEGNIEFLLALQKSAHTGTADWDKRSAEVVNAAHEIL
jgi:23S rRNA (cytidine1920-2'-O)/16S rRNA (cytidine1409-2'-O)-methyltransferase